MKNGTPWTPLVRGMGSPRLAHLNLGDLWTNAEYTVHLTERDGGLTELSIRRNDRKPARDWRDFQRIKNQLCGPEREAVELYPAESRLMDTANQYYLWVFPLGVTVPVGFLSRNVATPAQAEVVGAVQRPLDEGVEPTFTDEENLAMVRSKGISS